MPKGDPAGYLPNVRKSRRTNKRISHGSMLARDMRLIRGEPTKKTEVKTAPVGPSEGLIDKLMNRRKKFSMGTAK